MAGGRRVAEPEPEATIAAPMGQDAVRRQRRAGAARHTRAARDPDRGASARREPGARLPGQALARLQAHHARLAGDHSPPRLGRRGRRPGFPLVDAPLPALRGDPRQARRGLRPGHGQQDALRHEGRAEELLAPRADDGRRARQGLGRRAGARHAPSAGALHPARGAALALRGRAPRRPTIPGCAPAASGTRLCWRCCTSGA